MSDSIRTNELVEVKAILVNDDVVALLTGNMATLFRVSHNSISGETEFHYDGLAAMTGAFNTLRRLP